MTIIPESHSVAQAAAAIKATVMKALPARTRTECARLRYHMAEAFERTNREAALIILAERARYSGLPLIWADTVLRGERQSAAALRLVA